MKAAVFFRNIGMFGTCSIVINSVARPVANAWGSANVPSAALSNVDGDSTYVRVQVLTNHGALDRAKQIAVVSRLTALVAEAAGDPTLSDRIWVLLTEAPDGGWGLAGHANTNEELIAAARAQLAELKASAPPS